MVEIVVPGVPPSLNAWATRHWAQRHRDRGEWAAKVKFVLYAAHGRRRALFTVPVRVTLTYRVAPRLRKQRLDLDNMAPKHAVDALRGELFPDDGPQWVRELVQRIEEGAARDETVIRVEPLSEAL